MKLCVCGMDKYTDGLDQFAVVGEDIAKLVIQCLLVVHTGSFILHLPFLYI